MEDRLDAKRALRDHMQEGAKAVSQRMSSPIGDPRRIPLWATIAYGDQMLPSLRLPLAQSPQAESAKQESGSSAEDDTGKHFQQALRAASPREETRHESIESIQRKENTTGLPDTLKAGIETFSGLSLADVHVHYNSSKPAQVQALAYTQGTDIHVGPGQEQHLAHEAWHVVQQKQGRVRPTLQAKGVKINDDEGLESEADVMGQRVAAITGKDDYASPQKLPKTAIISTVVVQRRIIEMPDQQLTLDLEDLQAEQLGGPQVGLNNEAGLRVSNAAFMRFTVGYSLTNNSDAERNISIGLLQYGVQDDVTGQYGRANGERVEVSFGRDDLPFLDADPESSPYYSNEAYRQYDEFEPGEIVAGQLRIDDRPNIAIRHTITSPEGEVYTSVGLIGERGLRIWLGIKEDDNVIVTIPICTWRIDLANGNVEVEVEEGEAE